MPSVKTIVQGALIAGLGVFLAGLAMNALRDQPIVNRAINGFDG